MRGGSKGDRQERGEKERLQEPVVQIGSDVRAARRVVQHRLPRPPVLSSFCLLGSAENCAAKWQTPPRILRFSGVRGAPRERVRLSLLVTGCHHSNWHSTLPPSPAREDLMKLEGQHRSGPGEPAAVWASAARPS